MPSKCRVPWVSKVIQLKAPMQVGLFPKNEKRPYGKRNTHF